MRNEQDRADGKAHGRQRRICKVDVRFTEAEYQQIIKLERALGKNKTELVRMRILKDIALVPIDTAELRLSLDAIALDIKRAGNNINQIARHANTMRPQGAMPSYILQRFDELFERYLKHLKELEVLLRKIARSMAQR